MLTSPFPEIKKASPLADTDELTSVTLLFESIKLSMLSFEIRVLTTSPAADRGYTSHFSSSLRVRITLPYSTDFPEPLSPVILYTYFDEISLVKFAIISSATLLSMYASPAIPGVLVKGSILFVILFLHDEHLCESGNPNLRFGFAIMAIWARLK